MSLAGSQIEAITSLKRSSVRFSMKAIDDPTLLTIFTNLISCSFQTALGYVCLDIVFAISLHFVDSEVGVSANAGVGLAYTICSIILLPMGFGVNQSLNVHVSQAIGAEQTKLSKTYLPMTFYIHFMYFIPLCLIVYFLKVPFSYTIPNEDRDQTVDDAWAYLPWMMASSIFAIQLECFKSYLIAYEIFTPFIFIHFSTTALHFLWCWLFMSHYKYGINGAGFAIMLTEILNNVFLFLCVLASERCTLPFIGVPIKFSPLRQWDLVQNYIKSSFSIVLHVYADFFAFFMLTILSMQLGTKLFNAQIAFSNTSALYFRLPISLSIGLMTYIGAEMGRKRYKTAQKYAIMGGVIFAVSAGFLIGLIFLLRNQWANFYSSDEPTREAMLDTLPWFLLGCLLLDGLQGSISGGLKGIDKAQLVTNTTLVIYYIIGLPVVILFTFSFGLDLGVTGIWLGFGLANGFLAVIYITALIRTDWQKQEDQICQRIEEQNQLQKQKYSIVHSEVII